jgi:heat shock protein HtpX
MAVLHEAAIKRNRRRIVALAALAVINFWIAAVLLVFFVVLGAALALIVEGFFQGFDFELLAALFGVFPAVVAAVFTSPITAVVALVFVAIGTVYAVFTLFFRIRRVEGRVVNETGARVVAPGTDVQLDNLVNGLAISAGVPPPRVAIVEDPAPNAFAVGRKPETAVIGVTRGLLDTLSRDETEAVVSYEISSIASLDIALATWGVAVTGHTIEIWERSGRLLVKLGLLPSVFLARRLRRFALRGQAEQQDMLAVRFTRNPHALLDALVKLQQHPTVIARITSGTAPLWIETPVAHGSHLDVRVAKLRELVREPPPATAPTVPGDGPRGTGTPDRR